MKCNDAVFFLISTDGIDYRYNDNNLFLFLFLTKLLLLSGIILKRIFFCSINALSVVSEEMKLKKKCILN